MKIRKATRKDIPLLARKWIEFEDYQRSLWKGKKKKLNDVFEEMKGDPKKYFEKEISSHLRMKNSVYLIAEENGEFLGYISFSIKKRSPIQKLEKEGRLHYAYIEKEHRGKGIFKKLLKEAKKWFKEKGIKYWTLSVSPENPRAHKLYKELGFVDKEIEMIGKVK